MGKPPRVRIEGPLAVHAAGFWEHLLREGYTPLSALRLVRLLAHLSRWLQRKRLTAEDLEPRLVERYIRHRKRAGCGFCVSPRGVEPVLKFLRAAGAAPSVLATAQQRSSVDVFLGSYDDYLREERALAPSTSRFYRLIAEQFLAERVAGDARDFGALTAADVNSFVLSESRRWSVSYTKYKVTALRSLLRFLYLRGELATDLAGAVPAVAGWRLSGLPRGVPAADLQRVLTACDRRTPIGLRDYAILLLLSRLGLRAGEVAAIELDDIDWAAGTLLIHGKGRCESILPLPDDVGKALVDYLRRGRPRGVCRRVFLRCRAPSGPLELVPSVVRRAFARAGLPEVGAHRLRHTTATQMLARGASLSEIAQVLRHRTVDTTAIYAKVDLAALHSVAQPWPGATP